MNGDLVPDTDSETAAAVARLSRVLPGYAPRLWATLRPPVDDADLALLRDAVAPNSIPSALVTLLRWADGQVAGSTEWWPSLWCGPLLSARAIIAHYEKILVIAEDWQWSPMWLPITHSSWNQAAIELVTTGAGVVLDASWPDPPRVIAPSLSAALDATGDLAESGLLADATAPSIGPAWASWEERLRQVSSVRYEEVGWKNSPFEPGQDIDPERWPPGRRR